MAKVVDSEGNAWNFKEATHWKIMPDGSLDVCSGDATLTVANVGGPWRLATFAPTRWTFIKGGN